MGHKWATTVRDNRPLQSAEPFVHSSAWFVLGQGTYTKPTSIVACYLFPTVNYRDIRRDQ